MAKKSKAHEHLAKAKAAHAQLGKSLQDLEQMLQGAQQPQQPQPAAVSPGVSPLGGQAQ